jgi:hypothetical protein
VGTGLGVATETRDLGEVKAEALNEPVDGVARAVGEDVDEVVASKVTGRLLGVGEAEKVSVDPWHIRIGYLDNSQLGSVVGDVELLHGC